MEKVKFEVKKVANMYFIVSDCGTIFNSWHEADFTKRKMTNAMNKIQKTMNEYGKIVLFDINI